MKNLIVFFLIVGKLKKKLLKCTYYFVTDASLFFKYGPLFVYFRPFHVTNQLKTERSVDIVLGIRIWGRRMVGADGSKKIISFFERNAFCAKNQLSYHNCARNFIEENHAAL